MKLITLSADSSGYSYNEEEGYPPEEMEWRIVQAADEQFPQCKQLFFYDSANNPAVDLLSGGRCIHQLRFEAE